MTLHWRNPVAVRFGRGVSRDLLAGLEGPVLVVRGGRTLQRAGLDGLLGTAPDVHLAEAITGLPEAEPVCSLARQVIQVGARTVLGIGGGSALDAARATAVIAGHDDDPARALQRVREGEPLRRGVGLVLAPTTAGTGSEVTRWASLWESGHKWSVASPHGYADQAIVDPALTDTADARLTASSGLDALTHACEALWGVRHNAISDLHARRALELLGEHLLPAVRSSASASGAASWHRDGLSLASLHAGLAFSNTSTAVAHALSYEFTGRHGLEHGLAVGLLLRGALPFNDQVAGERVATAATCLGVGDVQGLGAFIDEVFLAAELRPSLAALGVPAEAHGAAVDSALCGNRLANNPGAPDADALAAMLERVA